jgi:hypothetical protein
MRGGHINPPVYRIATMNQEEGLLWRVVEVSEAEHEAYSNSHTHLLL